MFPYQSKPKIVELRYRTPYPFTGVSKGEIESALENLARRLLSYLDENDMLAVRNQYEPLFETKNQGRFILYHDGTLEKTSDLKFTKGCTRHINFDSSHMGLVKNKDDKNFLHLCFERTYPQTFFYSEQMANQQDNQGNFPLHYFLPKLKLGLNTRLALVCLESMSLENITRPNKKDISIYACLKKILIKDKSIEPLLKLPDFSKFMEKVHDIVENVTFQISCGRIKKLGA